MIFFPFFTVMIASTVTFAFCDTTENASVFKRKLEISSFWLMMISFALLFIDSLTHLVTS